MRTTRLTLLGTAALACLVARAIGDVSDSLAVTRLETQAAREPLGIDHAAPRLSWAIGSARGGVRQAASRVLVASRADLAREGRADIWDSKRVSSSDPWLTYAGPALASRTRYYWSVRVWAADGAASPWSEPTWFETAFMSGGEWKGQWIAGPERSRLTAAAEGEADDATVRAAGEFCRPVQWLTRGFAAARVKNDQGECREIRPTPMLRKTFTLTKPVTRARVYSSGLAYNDLSVNGSPVSASVLDPAFTDYSRTLLYTTHDVTSLLRSGENVIATELGSGHFDDATRTWDWGWENAQWRGRPGCVSTCTSLTPTVPRTSSPRTPHGVSARPARRGTTTIDGNRVVYDIGSGHYRFRVGREK